MILQVLIAMIAGWINRYQQQVIAYLLEENRILHAQLGDRRICFTDAERRRLAALAFPLGRKRLKSLTTLATPDTLMRWYKQLVAQKFDGSQKRNKLGRPRVADEIEALILQMANDNPTWGYRRIQGAWPTWDIVLTRSPCAIFFGVITLIQHPRDVKEG